MTGGQAVLASSGASFNFDRALDFGVRNASGGLLAGAEGAYVDKVKQYEVGFKAQDLSLGGGDLDFYGTLFLSQTEESNITITPPTGQIRKYDAKGLEPRSLELGSALGLAHFPSRFRDFNLD